MVNPILTRGRLSKVEKMQLLHMCLFEYLQRAEAYANAVMCNNLIDTKSAQIAEIIAIKEFKVTTEWRENFMREYGIRPFEKINPEGHVPEFTLQLERIFEHCWDKYIKQRAANNDSVQAPVVVPELKKKTVTQRSNKARVVPERKPVTSLKPEGQPVKSEKPKRQEERQLGRLPPHQVVQHSEGGGGKRAVKNKHQYSSK